MAIMTDYACTGDDLSIIETIRSEPSEERHLVSIDDAFLKKRHLLSLLTPGQWVGDEVSILILHYDNKMLFDYEYVSSNILCILSIVGHRRVHKLHDCY